MTDTSPPGTRPPAAGQLLSRTLAALRPLDADAVAAAREHQDRLTKRKGSLGGLEDVSVQLAGLALTEPPPLPGPAVVVVVAADHGVHAQGVSPWPQEVTAQMVADLAADGAVVNALAAQTGTGCSWSTSAWPATCRRSRGCSTARSGRARPT